MQNKNSNRGINSNQSRGFQNNPYINKGQDMQSEGIKNMNGQMQINQQNTQQNPYYNANLANQMNGQASTQNASIDSFLSSFDTKNFLIGAAIGAVGAYLFTNENAQKAIFKTIAQGSSMFQAGIEEMKERFEDAKAELEASKE